MFIRNEGDKDGMVYFLIWPDYLDTLVMSFLSYNATTGGGSLCSQENSELVGHVPPDLDISYLKLSKLLYSLIFYFLIYNIGMIRLDNLCKFVVKI